MREMVENLTGGKSDTPWQVRAVAYLGTPVVISVFLVWFLTVDVKTNQKAQMAEQQETNRLLREHIGAMNQQGSDSSAILRVMRTNCVNQAKDNMARAECLR